MPASALAVAIIALAHATPEKFPTRIAPAPSAGDNGRTPADGAPSPRRMRAFSPWGRLPSPGSLRRERVLAVVSEASQCLTLACPPPRTAAGASRRESATKGRPIRNFLRPSMATVRPSRVRSQPTVYGRWRRHAPFPAPFRGGLPRSDRLGLRCHRSPCHLSSMRPSTARILSCTRENVRLG